MRGWWLSPQNRPLSGVSPVNWQVTLTKPEISLSQLGANHHASSEGMKSSPHIIVTPASGITPEEARGARSRAWAYVFECWHAKKGGPHDLTTDATTEMVKNEPQKTGREKTYSNTRKY
jgi:hypothetical protein